MASFIKRLFRKKTSKTDTPSKLDINPEEPFLAASEPYTVVSEEQEISVPQTTPHLEVPQLIVGVAQSVGIQRDHNEDSLFTLTANLLVDERTINFGLYIIADGMGGHENGELASRLAVDGLASYVINSFYLPLLSSSTLKLEASLQEIMKSGALQAHHAIKRQTEGGGTTLTAALIVGDQLTIAHVGDSRAYYIDPLGDMRLLTRDHSLVKRLEEIGQISSEEAINHPQRNVLYRAVGQGEPTEPDMLSMLMGQGCQLLLCSDGLWGALPEDELAELASSSLEPQLACQSLVHAANQAGGPDNISVILIRLPG